MAVETSAGNTEEDINFEVKEGGGDVCLTCGARARSVVTREADRTQHGRTVGRRRVVVEAAVGRVPAMGVWRCRRGGRSLEQSRELVQDHESGRVCTSKKGVVNGGLGGGRTGGGTSRSY